MINETATKTLSLIAAGTLTKIEAPLGRAPCREPRVGLALDTAKTGSPATSRRSATAPSNAYTTSPPRCGPAASPTTSRSSRSPENCPGSFRPPPPHPDRALLSDSPTPQTSTPMPYRAPPRNARTARRLAASIERQTAPAFAPAQKVSSGALGPLSEFAAGYESWRATEGIRRRAIRDRLSQF
jgi:hypothetical protein